jgi:hypothetical protein
MKRHYVDNRRFLAEIIRYKELRRHAKADTVTPIPSYVGEAMQAIALNIARMPNFHGYSYRDEMVSDAVVNALHYLNSFNPAKSNNPFAYFTRVVYNAFLRRIDMEHKQQYIRDRSYYDNTHVQRGKRTTDDGVDEHQMLDRIERFERSKKRKKK